MKKTVIIGASPNSTRYSYLATQRLAHAGHEVVPIGMRPGSIDGHEILLGLPPVQNTDTVTLYINKEKQKELYDYILGLGPKRIIFNPGTENEDFAREATKRGIQTENACTLVLLSTNQF